MKDPYIRFEKDDYPFWEYLGLEENCSCEDVLKKVDSLSDQERMEPYKRFAWKMLKDPFYSQVYKKFRSISTLYDAGFFLDEYKDTNKISQDVRFLTTPFDKVVRNINESEENEKPYIVLLTTGGFSPIHKRHVEIMKVAKEKMETEGFSVVGGYISPSHDKYVSQKYGGEAAMHAEKRMYLVEKVVEDSDWLYADKWEAYYNRESVNFTDVIVRLEKYLNTHIQAKKDIKVCFVFGADNAGFVKTFVYDGYAVCLDRIGYEDKMEEAKREFRNSDRVFFVDNTEKEKTSSSLVRKGARHLLDEKIQSFYTQIQTIKNSTSKQDIYAIRNDAKKALDLSGIQCEKRRLEETLEIFESTLLSAFEGEISVKWISLKKQYEQGEKLISKSKIPSLSLDVYIHGDANIEISRLFEMGTGQFKPKKLVSRPGAMSLNEQLEKVKPAQYMLVEDDVASGNTLKKLKEMLPSGVEIQEKLILSQLDETIREQEFFDIVDMRDFLFGIKHSGLVVSLPNEEPVRVPYVLPYTSPISRAKIPFGKEVEFSLEVWKMNKTFYQNLGKEFVLGDMDSGFVKLMEHIGFTKGDKMTEIIDWHVEKLERAIE